MSCKVPSKCLVNPVFLWWCSDMQVPLGGIHRLSFLTYSSLSTEAPLE